MSEKIRKEHKFIPGVLFKDFENDRMWYESFRCKQIPSDEEYEDECERREDEARDEGLPYSKPKRRFVK